MFTEFRKIGHNSGKIGASCVNNGWNYTTSSWKWDDVLYI
jgi:hypothetical protein